MKTLDANRPLGVDQATFKAAVHLDNAVDDAVLAGLLLAAQGVVEAACGCFLSPALVEFRPETCGWRRWWFPVRPIDEVTAVASRDAAGAWTDHDAAQALLIAAHDEPVLSVPEAWSEIFSEATELRVTASVLAETDARLRQAVILTAKEWLDAGIEVDGVEPPRLSFGPENLIRQARYMRPRVVALD